MSICPYTSEAGDNLFRLNILSKKIEQFLLIDATPFSNVNWEKNRIVKIAMKELKASTTRLWNTSGSFGLNIPAAGHEYEGANVAVLDTGVYQHSEYSHKLLPGYDFISEVHLSLDGDGRDSDFDPNILYPADCVGNASDFISHGTHVTGLIASEGNLETSNYGVSPKSSILPVRVLGPCGGNLIDVLEGMLWAAGEKVGDIPINNEKVHIVNLSLGGPGECPPSMQEVIDVLISKGIISVVAAGNSSLNLERNNFFPANCKRVISVGATNYKGLVSSYSNYGEDLFYAPGGDHSRGIYSTIAGFEESDYSDSFGEMSGTSMAAPQVAGLVALIKARSPDLSFSSVKNVLKASVGEHGIVSFSAVIQNLGADKFEDLLSSGGGNDINESIEEKDVIGCGSLDVGSGSGPSWRNRRDAFQSLLVGVFFLLFISISNFQRMNIL